MSKRGLEKSLTKGGAGALSYGSVQDELELARAGELDASLDLDLDDEARVEVHCDTTTGTIVATHTGFGVGNDASSEGGVASLSEGGREEGDDVASFGLDS